MSIEIQNYGNRVICDYCNEEYTDRLDVGGLLFQSKAACPECAAKMEPDIIRFNETHFIRARCPAGMSYANWVRDVLRGGKPGIVTIYTGDDAIKSLDH